MDMPIIVGGEYCSPEETNLTVAKKLMDFHDGNFVISDSEGNALFKLQQKKVFLSELTVLRDAADCPVVAIQKKGFSLHDTYQVYRGADTSEQLFTVKDKHLRDGNEETYVVELEGAEDPSFEVKGDFVRRNYQVIFNKSTIVADVAKKSSITSWFTGKNKYGVKVSPNVDKAFVATVVTIMEAIHNEIKEKNGDGDKSSDSDKDE